MAETPNLALPYLEAAQAQKHVTHNDALTRLDAAVQIGVVSRAIAAPPSAAAEGERYIVAAPGAGAWAGQGSRLTALADGAWLFIVPRVGWLAFVEDEAALLVFDGVDWLPAVAQLPTLGLGTPPAMGNALTVSGDASLFTAATADTRIALNKTAPAATASLVFQTGYSARAEFGLAGDDDFRLKVSADGTAFRDAFGVARDSGAVSFAAPPRLPQFSAAALPAASVSAALIYVFDAAGGAAPAYCDGGAWRRLADNSPII